MKKVLPDLVLCRRWRWVVHVRQPLPGAVSPVSDRNSRDTDLRLDLIMSCLRQPSAVPYHHVVTVQSSSSQIPFFYVTG